MEQQIDKLEDERSSVELALQGMLEDHEETWVLHECQKKVHQSLAQE